MRKNLLVILIVIGGVAGAFCGWFFGPAMESFAFLGDLFLNALKMIVVPLIIFSMVAGIASLGDIRKVGGVGWKTLVYYFSTTAIAVVIGLVLVNIMKPGVGVDVSSVAMTTTATKTAGIIDIILSFVPENIFQAMAETRMLPLIFMSLLFGGVLTTIGEKGKQLLDICKTINDVLIKIVHLILYFAPIGVFALVANMLGKSGGGDAFFAEVSKVGMYSMTVISGLAIHGLIVLPLILFFLAKRSPLRYGAAMLEALVTSFSTSSSSATLPVTIECAKRRGVNEAAADFVLPIGATINMDGTALYEAVAAMFIAQSYGIELGFIHQVVIFLTATLASIGAAGIPQAGLVTMLIVLEAVGLPNEGIGMILAVDWFLDRCRTTINVWGDAVGAAVISRCKELNS
ncbi:MAG: dicarboxylate/amino acid:cation symporter [Deltaproteobacteria bacterium]|jgi:solute carrier family 1 (neuronal/epithelial high affinity glutamate transporter), member 1|nr:dicarboxylate/amino acid:cation symporter [Deltaproteobacteria bacterium]